MVGTQTRARWTPTSPHALLSMRRPTIIYNYKGTNLIVARSKHAQVRPHDQDGQLDLEVSEKFIVWYQASEDVAKKLHKLNAQTHAQFLHLASIWSRPKIRDSSYEWEWPFFVRHVCDHWLHTLASGRTYTGRGGQGTLEDPFECKYIEDADLRLVLENMEQGERYDRGFEKMDAEQREAWIVRKDKFREKDRVNRAKQRDAHRSGRVPKGVGAQRGSAWESDRAIEEEERLVEAMILVDADEASTSNSPNGSSL